MIGLGGSSLGGVLAYAFMQMKGVGGLAAWRWIFIMEALLTIVVAAIAFVFLVDYPQNAHKAWNFLTQREATMMLRRVEKDRGDTEEDQEFDLARFLRPALDLRVWGYGMIWWYVLRTCCLSNEPRRLMMITVLMRQLLKAFRPCRPTR